MRKSKFIRDELAKLLGISARTIKTLENIASDVAVDIPDSLDGLEQVAISGEAGAASAQSQIADLRRRVRDLETLVSTR